jgi:hypothetical protein
MMRHTPRPTVTLIIALWALAIPTVLFAQDEAFKKGLEARNQKNWSAAAQQMRKAIEADGNESTRKIREGFRGTFGSGTEYFPHYFLGEALNQIGDCAGAVVEWETSEDQKVVLSRTEFAATISRGYKTCAAKGVLLRNDYQQHVSATDLAYQAAHDVSERITKIRATHPDLWQADTDQEFERGRSELEAARARFAKARQSRLESDFTQSKDASARASELLRAIETKLTAAITSAVALQSRSSDVQRLIASTEETDRAIDATRVTLTAALAVSRESARQSLARAREQLGSGDKGSPAAITQAEMTARTASKEMAGVLAEARKMVRGLVEQQVEGTVAVANQEFSFVQALLSQLDRLSAKKPEVNRPDLVRQRKLVEDDVTAARRRLDSARRSASIAGVQEATRLAGEARLRLDAIIKEFGPATLRDRGVAPELEQGVTHYLAGDYQKALDALGPSGSLRDAPLQVHVHLFRAASLYALYLFSGGTNEALRTNAATEVQRCKEIDEKFQPSPRAFAPRFIQFFQNTNTSGAGPSQAAP